jgi:hypothetical protein
MLLKEFASMPFAQGMFYISALPPHKMPRSTCLSSLLQLIIVPIRWIETPMVSVMHQYNLMEAVVKRTPLGRTGRPEEIADCAVFLSSKLSSFVVGAGLMADGGITIN